MPRPKIYTAEQTRERRRQSSLKWMRKNIEYVCKRSAEWAKLNPDKIKKTRSSIYKRNKDCPSFRLRRLISLMLDRCYNSNSKSYFRYGGRGITVCDEWRLSKSSFVDWALKNGYQLGLTIERIDNNGNYNPRNCTFASKKQQNNNRRSNKFIYYDGQNKTLSQWSEFFNIPKATLWWRFNQGHSLDKVFYKNHLQSHENLTSVRGHWEDTGMKKS